ncbi:MAG: alpha-L-glutamate ligase [Gammaproteobacteria bacterium]|nr:alpha-L-glutamate ligase [Gammaproteobacteria bacterium]
MCSKNNSSPKIVVLHENSEWVDTYSKALTALGVEYEFWDLRGGVIDIDKQPPLDVFYVRMSASAHSRGNVFAADHARMLVRWLESHNRRVINGSKALNLELSKAEQYLALKDVGVPVPHTLFITGEDSIDDTINKIKKLPIPFIVKPNRGGKGEDVELVSEFGSIPDLLRSKMKSSPDGTILVQEYIQAKEPFIIRNEFVGGEFLYSVKVDTRDGFELCPADFCEAGSESLTAKFDILCDFEPPNLAQYQQLLKDYNVEIAGIEMIQDGNGETFTYDINVNTNYNTLAEQKVDYDGTEKAGLNAVCRFLKTELEKIS